MTEKNRRVCKECGEDRHISRFPKRGKGRSWTCRLCVETAEEIVEKGPGGSTEETSSSTKDASREITSQGIDPDLEVEAVPSKQVQQILLMAKDLRKAAKELRKYAREYLPEGKIEWVDESPARMLDMAAVQLELLCQ